MLARIRGFRFIDVSLPQNGSVLCCLPTPDFLAPTPPPPPEDAAEYSVLKSTPKMPRLTQRKSAMAMARARETENGSEKAQKEDLI